eukprot:scaffold102540_cov63-Phaeocystis_antarctica.AAC.2
MYSAYVRHTSDRPDTCSHLARGTRGDAPGAPLEHPGDRLATRQHTRRRLTHDLAEHSTMGHQTGSPCPAAVRASRSISDHSVSRVRRGRGGRLSV